MKTSKEGREFASVLSAAEIKLYFSTQIWSSLVKVKKVQSRATNIV